MQSKVSWLKRGIFMQDLRTVGWIGIIYQIALLFALPLQIIMMYETDSIPYHAVESSHNLFQVLQEVQVLLMFTVPVLLGVVLFRYMQVKVSADFIHSLPVKRSSIFHHHLLIGLLLLVVPVVITALITGIVHGVLELGSGYFQVSDIAYWAGITIMMNVFVFALTALIGTVSGISAVQAVLTYIFLIFPAGIMVLLYFNMKYFIFGFAYDYFFDRSVYLLSPIIRMVELRYSEALSGKEITIYLLLTVVFYVLGLFAYNKRHIEGATQAIAFRYLKPIFKYGVTFCSMLLGGVYFAETQQGDYGWLLFGYFFGSVIGYVIAEMVLQKTWRVFRSLKWYVVYGVIVAVFGILLNADITGYEKKMPVATDIERAYFGDGIHWFNEKNHRDDNVTIGVDPYTGSEIVNTFEETDRYFFVDAENINSILKLHQQVIEDKKELHNNNHYYWTIGIGYELKNGSTIIRQYEITHEAYKEYLKPIYESHEYKNSNNEFLRLNKNISVDKIKISAHSRVSKSYETLDQTEIDEMMVALKEAMLEETYEDMFDDREKWAEIELLLENNQWVHVPWKKSYYAFDRWMQENELIAQARVVPEDIDYAIVVENDQYLEDTPPHKMIEEATQFFVTNENGLKIVEPEQLEECLWQTTWGTSNKQYVIAIYFKDEEDPVIQGLQTPPPFVEQHFN
ncbi:DUF6449 domain-containing protein [Calidifontibacillus oryziterrae]|uniref:DUF6449 domain-containing protein n=1 Tax=Calidifontibacillus oryziterrae TaxID=1191699 RepID=UPI000360DA67|nr:DUF6449 domain-containing protein [Calidifontibacillus oryziterrae]